MLFRCLLLFIFFPSYVMGMSDPEVAIIPSEISTNIAIKTSNRKLECLPLWKVRESKTLQKLLAQEAKNDDNPLKTLTISSISFEQLKLFSDALEYPIDTFYQSFYSLTPDEQKLLIITAGKHSQNGLQLHVPSLMSFFLRVYLPEDIISTCIDPHLNVESFIYYLKNKQTQHAITDKKWLTNTITDARTSIAFKPDGQCSIVPTMMKNIAPHCRSSVRLFPQLNVSESSYLVAYAKHKKNTDCLYQITESRYEPLLKLKEADIFFKTKDLLVWMCNRTSAPTLVHTLSHPYPIESCSFSPDGNYLLSISTDPEYVRTHRNEFKNNAVLKLTTLGVEPQGKDTTELIIADSKYWIVTACFSPDSQKIAAATTNGIYIWDITGKELHHLYNQDCPIVTELMWNHDGTAVYALEKCSQIISLSSCFTLYDIVNNTENIIPIIYENAQRITIKSDNTILISYSIEPQQDQQPRMSLMKYREENEEYPYSFSSYPNRGFLKIDKKTHTMQKILLPDCTSFDMDYSSYIISPDETLIVVAGSRLDNHVILTPVFMYNTITQTWSLIGTYQTITGVCFSRDSQSLIITTNHSEHTKIDLFSDEFKECYGWIFFQANTAQRYALLELYKSLYTKNALSLNPKSPLFRILEELPIEPCNIKKFVKTHGNITHRLDVAANTEKDRAVWNI